MNNFNELPVDASWRELNLSKEQLKALYTQMHRKEHSTVFRGIRLVEWRRETVIEMIYGMSRRWGICYDQTVRLLFYRIREVSGEHLGARSTAGW